MARLARPPAAAFSAPQEVEAAVASAPRMRCLAAGLEDMRKADRNFHLPPLERPEWRGRQAALLLRLHSSSAAAAAVAVPR